VKYTLISVSLVFIILILASTVGSAAQVIKIGSGSGPAIDDRKIVWTDNGVVQIYDLTTKKETTISSAAAFCPAISGNKLVWLDKSTGIPRLTVYDIKSDTRSQITQNVDNNSAPAINDCRIVWSANGCVYMYDILNSTQTKIAAGDNPDIYGNKISYDIASTEEYPQVYVYDITTRKAVNVSKYGDNYYSRIYGNKVIWSDFYTKLGNIRMYDIATKQQTEVTTGNETTGYDTGGATDIYGKKIVYVKHNGLMSDVLGDVYVYDMETGRSMQLSSGNSAQTPVVSGNTIVWSDSGNIFMTDLAA
jgi:beta propeller repeat protein